MREHRVVAESGEFSEEFFEKEKKRAIKELEKADNFILLYHNKGETGSGGGISCVSSDQIMIMGFNLDKMNRETRATIKTLIKAGAITLPDFLK